MPALAELQSFPLERFLAGFFYTTNPSLAPATAALYPSHDFVCDRGLIQKRPGDVELQASPQTLSGRLQKTFDWIDKTGVYHLFLLTTTTLYHYNPSTGNFDTFLSGLHGTTPAVPQAASFFGKMLFFNGGDPVFESDGTLANTKIVTGAPVAYTGVVLGGRVVVGNVVSGGAGVVGPTVLAWSNSNDETNWTTGSAGQNVLDQDDNPVQRLVIPRAQQALIVRRHSVWTATLLDSSPYYDIESAAENIGTAFPDSVQVTPQGVVIAGDDNLYIITGTSPQPVGIAVREFMQSANLQYARQAVATTNLTKGQYILALAFGGDTDVIDQLVYNYVEGHISYWQKQNLTGLGATYALGSATIWSQLTQAWSAYGVTWQELAAIPAQHQTIYLKTDGRVYLESPVRKDRYNGADATYTMLYETPAFPVTPYAQTYTGQILDPTPAIVEMVQLDCTNLAATPTVQLGWSRGPGVAPAFSTARAKAIPTSGPSTGGLLFGFDTREAPYWQLLISDANVENLQIIRVTLWYRRRGAAVRAT